MPKFKDSNGKDSKIVFVKSMLETQLAQDQFINENTIINSDGTLDLIVNDKITIKNYKINSETKVIKEGQIFVKGIKLFSLENGKVKDIDIHKDKEIFLKKNKKDIKLENDGFRGKKRMTTFDSLIKYTEELEKNSRNEKFEQQKLEKLESEQPKLESIPEPNPE